MVNWGVVVRFIHSSPHWFIIMKFVKPSILIAVSIGICTFAPSAQALDYESKAGFTTLSLAEGNDKFKNTAGQTHTFLNK